MTTTTPRPLAVVTGASSGIGAATARRLAGEGFHVVTGARRFEQLERLAAEIGGTPVRLDVTSEESVTAFAARVRALGAPVRVLVNNAGGARGLDHVGDAKADHWRAMYELNVLGTQRVTKALLPDLEESGDGVIVLIGSTAGHTVYEGGAGYCGVKHAVAAMARTLRLELVGTPVRVVEIAPGMVHTEEFSLNRFDGDRDKAAAVYAGVPGPLVAEDVADCVAWAATRPAHVNIDLLMVRPRAQAANHKVHRVS